MSAIPLIKPFITESAIAAKVAELGQRLAADYADLDPVVVSISNGAMIFTADLIRRMPIPLSLDSIMVGSYESNRRGALHDFRSRLKIPLKGRHVLIVDEILDSGNTLSRVRDAIAAEQPADIKICVLLDKQCVRENAINADYSGFEIPDLFVVGYGLDYDERCRNLPYIGIVDHRPETRSLSSSQSS